MLKLPFVNQSKQLTLPRLKGNRTLGLRLRFLLAPTCVLHFHITSLQIPFQTLTSVYSIGLKFIIPQFIQGQQIHSRLLKSAALSAIFVKTATIDNKEVSILENFKLRGLLLNTQIFLSKQMKTPLNLCIEAVKIVESIADQTEIRLLNLYNPLTYYQIETLDGHRGSGRLQLQTSY